MYLLSAVATRSFNNTNQLTYLILTYLMGYKPCLCTCYEGLACHLCCAYNKINHAFVQKSALWATITTTQPRDVSRVRRVSTRTRRLSSLVSPVPSPRALLALVLPARRNVKVSALIFVHVSPTTNSLISFELMAKLSNFMICRIVAYFTRIMKKS